MEHGADEPSSQIEAGNDRSHLLSPGYVPPGAVVTKSVASLSEQKQPCPNVNPIPRAVEDAAGGGTNRRYFDP